MIDLQLSGALPFGLSQSKIQTAIEKTLRACKQSMQGSVSCAFVTDGAIQKLNKTYRKKNRPTDVLSFGQPELPQKGVPRHWGDIFISPTYVKHEAARRAIAPQEELLRVLIHGMLHLLGFDHATEEDETEMFSLQENILAKLV
jgi:probable rRNA maturation factor